MNIPYREKARESRQQNGPQSVQPIWMWIAQPPVVGLLIALLLLLLLGEGVKAAFTSTTATVNGQTSVTVYAGEEMPVVVTVSRDGGTNWRRTSYRYGNSDSWTCVNTTDYDGSGTNSTTILVNAPGSTGSSTLNIRAHSNSSNCNDTPPAGGTASLTVTVVNQPASVTNPDLVASCGLDVILVLDESYSIQLSSAVGNVRTAALAFLNGLNNTGSRVAIVEFNTQARQVFGYTVVNDANLTAMTNYVNAGGGSPQGGYDPTAYSGSQYFTNWDDAFEKVKALNNTAVAPLVVFVTDGDPTTYNLADGTQFSSPSASVSSVGLSKAIAEANLVRQQGSHILTVGVGEALNNTGSQDRLKAISGNDVYTSGTLNLSTTDVMLVPNFNNLAAALQQIVTALCQSSVTLTKLVDPGTGVYQPASGWKFSASARYPAPSGTNFTWSQPYSAPATQVVSSTTTGDGTMTFQWKPNATTGTSTIVITETQQSGFQLISPIACTKQVGGGSPTSFNVTPSGSSFTISGIEVEASVTCQVRNQSVNGFVHAFKFEDLNENGIYDSNESPIAGWPFCINNGQTCVNTNEDGFATFGGLTLNQSVTISETLTGNWNTVMPTSQTVTAHSLVNNGVLGPVSVDMAVNGKPFEVALVSHVGNTWTYALSRTDGGTGGASHWVLGLGTCFEGGKFVSATPAGVIGADPSTGGFYGIKWDPGTLGQYTITLNGNYPEGSVTALVKDGAGYVTKYIRGPVCDAIFGNFETIPDVNLGDRVWVDQNFNGIQDDNEPGLSNLTVKLYKSDHTFVADTVTDANGIYTFTVAPDTYYLEFITPSGYSLTLQNQGGDNTKDSDPNPYTGKTAPFAVNGPDDTRDAGFFLLTECLPTINFDHNVAGTPLAAGTVVNNQWSPWGVYVTTDEPVDHPPLIFNSENPTGGDPDLGTPNQDFGGPGVGAGGKLGMPGENSQPLGKVLIISEDSISQLPSGDGDGPDDNAGGGTMIFTFTHGVRVDQVQILDIDDFERGGTITAYSDTAGNNLITSEEMLGLGDNSFQAVPLNALNVRRLEIEFPGSGSVPALVFCAPSADLYNLGDFIWNDFDADGEQDANEFGIADVEMELYVGNTLAFVTTTDANGIYTFTNLPNGTYIVTIASDNFAANGPLNNYNYSPQNAGGVDDADDSDFNPVTRSVAVTIADADDLTIDGGFFQTFNTDYEISKTLNTPEPVRVGELISFTIRITNSGNVTLTTLPLSDTYDPNYLVYVGSLPHSDDNVSDGTINWSDLTASAPTGFGVDLSPGASFAVVVEFVANADTTALLPNGATINTATVENAFYDPDGPGGIPPLGPLPPKSAEDDVSIFAPTAVLLSDYGLASTPALVRVHWQTVDESNIAYFDLYRIEDGQQTLVTQIMAERTGQPTGYLYTYEDTQVVTDQWYAYQLKVFGVDGTNYSTEIGSVYTGNLIFLPTLTR